MRPGVPDVHISDPQDEQLAEYRALAGQSVLGLIFGLLAPLAMVDPMLWSLPVVGMFFSVWALRRIKQNAPAMIGRKMALIGLTLSVLFLTAAPTDWLCYRRMVRAEARQFADAWWQYLASEQPQKAHQLTVAPAARQPLNDRLWDYYRNNPRAREELESYVSSPLVRTMLALGPKARVRFYHTASQSQQNNADHVELLYAVTLEEQAEKKTFFVSLPLMRTKLSDGRADWRVLRAEGGVRPDGW